jgi:hypothetical protein
MEALSIAWNSSKRQYKRGELPPPPPPAMDDPSDPPPSIDSDFRSPDLHLRHSPPPHSSPSPHPVYNQLTEQTMHYELLPITPANPQNHGHAPPPYLVPGNGGDQEHVTRPPPYMDLMPQHLTDIDTYHQLYRLVARIYYRPISPNLRKQNVLVMIEYKKARLQVRIGHIGMRGRDSK